MRRRVSILAASPSVAALLGAGPASTSDERTEHPRIGLVLSGGGALGSAHVGVLKTLEELRIPVHCVAGTSMGAIVGGLYAAGVSPAEMEQIFAETDWRELFDDRPPRRQLPYRRKVDDQTYLTRFEAGFNHGKLQLPPGLISGQKLSFLLQTLVLPAAGIDDFDDLPIPFRAVATDLATGDMVVLAKGDLGRAMRASMSIPGVFSPVEVDGRLLVDGGLVRNLPVDVALEMGADVVIAVDVGLPLFGKTELASLAKVINQTIGMHMRKNTMEQAKHAAILIKPDLEGFSSSQFERALEMVPLGEAAAQKAAVALSSYSLSEQQYADYRAHLRRPREAPEEILSVQLTLSSTADAERVLSKINTRPGDRFDAAVVKRDLERLYETGDYERVDYFLSKTDEGYVLHIEAHDKSWGPNYLRLGLNLFADLEGESSFDMLGSYTMSKLNRLRGEFKVDVQVGENPTISGEFYQPLSRAETWFAAASWRQSTRTIWAPVGQGLHAAYRNDAVEGELDLGLQLGRYGELRLGVTRTSGVAELRGGEDATGGSVLPEEIEYEAGGYRLTAIIDQFDNMNFPRHGYFSMVDYFAAREVMGSDSDYEGLAAFAGGAITCRRHTVLTMVNLYSALQSDSPVIHTLGGLFRLSGSR